MENLSHSGKQIGAPGGFLSLGGHQGNNGGFSSKGKQHWHVQDQLNFGGRLYSNLNGPGKNHLLSKNGKYCMEMQSDGNLCVDRLNLDGKGKNKLRGQGRKDLLWGIGIRNKAKQGPFYIDMQKDGNLVVYNTFHKCMWSSKSDGRSEEARLVMQNDGNLVMYDFGTNVSGKNSEFRPKCIWSTQTDGGNKVGNKTGKLK